MMIEELNNLKPSLPLDTDNLVGNNPPEVCAECGGNEFTEIEIDRIGSILCESEIRCSKCNLLNAVYGYGFYQHVNQIQ